MPLLKSKPTVDNIVTVLTPPTPPTPAQEAQVVAIKKSVAKSTASNTMSKADWAAKDRRISRQGLFQAALQSVGILQLNTGNTLEDYIKLVEQVAERGLQFVSKE